MKRLQRKLEKRALEGVVVVLEKAGEMREVRGEVWCCRVQLETNLVTFFFCRFQIFFTSKSVCTAHLLGDWTWPKRRWTPDRLARYRYKLPTQAIIEFT